MSRPVVAGSPRSRAEYAIGLICGLCCCAVDDEMSIADARWLGVVSLALQGEYEKVIEVLERTANRRGWKVIGARDGGVA